MTDAEKKVARAICEAHCDIAIKGPHTPTTDRAYAPLARAAIAALIAEAEAEATRINAHAKVYSWSEFVGWLRARYLQGGEGCG